MKVFFGLLLIVNIVFVAFQWLLPYQYLSGESRKIPAAEELQLLNDSNAKFDSESQIVAEVKAETDAIEEAVARIEKQIENERTQIVTEDSTTKRLCYTIGPIKDMKRAVEISGRYSANDVETTLKSSEEKDYQGVMVYIDGHKNRKAAVKTANALTAKGIRDHIIVKNPERPNILSLGVFGLKKNADRLKARVEKLNFKVKTEFRYREHTIYWLYNEQSSEAELENFLEAADTKVGINQISTQCLPS